MATAKKNNDVPATKMSRAIKLYAEMIKKPNMTRTLIIEAFIADVGLTKAGAATYYWKIKSQTKKAV